MEQWHENIIDETHIQCYIEEDTAELCKYFQVGICKKYDNNDCNWQHTKCSKFTMCSKSNCFYGHAKGIRTKMVDNGTLETKVIEN
jgi:hypothetical protein